MFAAGEQRRSKGTVIFGRSGRAPKMMLEDSAYTRIVFILSVYFADL